MKGYKERLSIFAECRLSGTEDAWMTWWWAFRHSAIGWQIPMRQSGIFGDSFSPFQARGSLFSEDTQNQSCLGLPLLPCYEVSGPHSRQDTLRIPLFLVTSFSPNFFFLKKNPPQLHSFLALKKIYPISLSLHLFNPPSQQRINSNYKIPF